MRLFGIFIFTAYSHLLDAFTITVPKDLYVVEYGSNVTIECNFHVENQLDLLSLVVYWEKEDKQIIQFVYGEEDPKVQHSSFRDRAWLLKDQLFKGNAVLQITDVKLQDAGVYCCMIGYGGADYKRITLKVNAPYRNINQRISMDPVTSEHELSCQAEGYPEAEVIWTSSDHQILSGNTTVTKSQREEKFFNVTSVLRINATANDIFYCTFRRLGSGENDTAELIIPEQYNKQLSLLATTNTGRQKLFNSAIRVLQRAVLVTYKPPTIYATNERNHFLLVGTVLLFLVVTLVLLSPRRDVSMKDVEKGSIQDMNSKKQNDIQFEET